MEPENRPYVDPDTKPGDTGTEEWADTLTGSHGTGHRGPLADPNAAPDDDGVPNGSPAHEFINDPDAVAARNGEAERT